MHVKTVIYPAAALFNARETYFNSILVEKLENLGYKTNFPQRDGFEFGNLKKALSGLIPASQINTAVSNVIYYLDMGVLLKGSDVILANLDEPLDEGVVVEASYGKLMGKFVIGLRTDIRSPYGRPDDDYGAMHFFPAYQTHRFISHYMPSRTPEERVVQMDALALKIHDIIIEDEVSHQEIIPDYAWDNPNLNKVFEGAEVLFNDIDDIHSTCGLETIASRYIKNKKKLEEIGPKR
jgi:nucleoside 2-deoxyribosyltransferase